MALTQLQKLELNKRVDKIFHAPSNAAVRGHQPEIAFVADMSGNVELIHSSIKDAAASLKAHDKLFQNMRSNMVYWGDSISSKVTPMSFILMGKAFDDNPEARDFVDKNVDNSLIFENLCEYLKLYHARCRCILIFMDCTCEELEKRKFYVADKEKALQNLNPFLKHRMLVITKDKMLAGIEMMMKVVNTNETE